MCLQVRGWKIVVHDSDGVHLSKNCHLKSFPTLGSLFMLVLPNMGYLREVMASAILELSSS